MEYSLSVAGDLFEGYTLVLPYPLWKRLDSDWELPKMTHDDRVAAFEAYEKEYGAQSYYLEEEFDENGEENDDYDPYLWIRPYDKPAESTWREISLEEAVCWTEGGCRKDYDFYPDHKITEAEIGKAVASFCENPHWKEVYTRAPAGAKRHLELTFLESDNGELIDANEEEFEDELERIDNKLGVKDWEYLIGMLQGQGGAAARTIRRYEKRLAVARERVVLKGTSASRQLSELKRIHADWQAGRLGSDDFVHQTAQIAEMMKRLEAIGRAPEGVRRRFDRLYSTMQSVVNV